MGHVVSRSQSSVLDVRTACERRERRSCRKALVQFNELVMLMTFEKPENKNETQNCIGIILDLVDRSDRVVVGTNVVRRMTEEQRGDARDAKSARGVPWQQSSAETGEGEMVNAACAASVRLTGTVMDPRK